MVAARPRAPTPTSSRSTASSSSGSKVTCTGRTVKLPVVSLETGRRRGHKVGYPLHEASDGHDGVSCRRPSSASGSTCLPSGCIRDRKVPVRGRVRFRLAANTEHAITPYSQIYGEHPDFFDFDRSGSKSSAASADRSRSSSPESPTSAFEPVDLFQATFSLADSPPLSARAHRCLGLSGPAPDLGDSAGWSPLPRLPRPPSPLGLDAPSWW